ncbi:unnamed protein product, partial [Chrysoparadoxa australica]
SIPSWPQQAKNRTGSDAGRILAALVGNAEVLGRNVDRSKLFACLGGGAVREQ